MSEQIDPKSHLFDQHLGPQCVGNPYSTYEFLATWLRSRQHLIQNEVAIEKLANSTVEESDA
jgi:hypothetical protein